MEKTVYQLMRENGVKNIHQKLIEIQSEIEVMKDGQNKFQKYDYFKIEDILLVYKPLAKKYGVKDWFMPIWDNEAQIYRCEHIFVNADYPEDTFCYRFDIHHGNLAGQCAQQTTGSSNTYAKRYSLQNVLNLNDSEEEPDRKNDHKGFQDNNGEKQKPKSSFDRNAVIDKINKLTEERKAKVLEVYKSESVWKLKNADLKDYLEKTTKK